MRRGVKPARVIAAATELDVTVPLVVRLQGTNAAEGREILESAGITVEQAKLPATSAA